MLSGAQQPIGQPEKVEGRRSANSSSCVPGCDVTATKLDEILTQTNDKNDTLSMHLQVTERQICKLHLSLQLIMDHRSSRESCDVHCPYPLSILFCTSLVARCNPPFPKLAHYVFMHCWCKCVKEIL